MPSNQHWVEHEHTKSPLRFRIRELIKWFRRRNSNFLGVFSRTKFWVTRLSGFTIPIHSKYNPTRAEQYPITAAHRAAERGRCENGEKRPIGSRVVSLYGPRRWTRHVKRDIPRLLSVVKSMKRLWSLNVKIYKSTQCGTYLNLYKV